MSNIDTLIEGIRHCLRIDEKGEYCESTYCNSCPFDKDEKGEKLEVEVCKKVIWNTFCETIADLQNVIKLLEDEK